ncbi:proline--tRNA ligase [Rhodothermus bifroesti]|uniref:Proline--tRNA ligase n=1 Tax=Rhodothermus marinus TaxID=29549 RepID=A0A7V2AYT0_RHOMR|nr:proline--tRNA ligase [Rhodothermus bifroesti]GBD00715.1 Proline--tRNA ligase [bacterium HR18]
MADVITPRSVDYAQWYVDVVRAAKLADYSPVRGCMIIRPNGYALWENMRAVLDRMFKETGHENAYFPLFIPESFLAKEAEHVEGFAKECAVVTHSRLKLDEHGRLVPDPESRLEENLIVRPTSETIIWDAFSRWIQSWRDLPILINQWANVVRWEMRTRLFLRTMEFLWQEGHTAHATREEAIEEALRILDIYTTFAEEYMAMPVIQGVKTPSERFAGAVETYCIEALMQDGKALQAGTSHFLGQNFAKAFNCVFQNQNNELEYVWATSWGVSTRLIGALVMTHSDDQGLVLPPRLAPTQVVIVPIFRNDTEKSAVLEQAIRLERELKDAGFTVKLDARETYRPGWKFNEYEVQGVPVRLAIGPRDAEQGTVELARRDTRTKETVPQAGLSTRVRETLEAIQQNLLARARAFRDEMTTRVDTYEEFKAVLEEKGGFILAPWDGTPETEARIKEETKATIRCIPLDRDAEQLGTREAGRDMLTGKPSKERVLFARAY